MNRHPSRRLHWMIRWPIKWLVFALAIFLVQFPNVMAFSRHFARWRDPGSVIDPNCPAMQPMVDELSLRIPGSDPALATKAIQDYVYKKIPYEWDWNTWINADYIPTVDEVIRVGKEDCDGRAVLAASLLRRFGYQADLVTDLAHVWVRTNHGDVMDPGRQAVAVSGAGRLSIQKLPIVQALRSLAYGIAVFPLYRLLIILAVLCAICMPRRKRLTTLAVAGALLVNGLLWIRVGGVDYWHPILWMQFFGTANLLTGFGLLWLHGRTQPVAAVAGAITA